MKSLRTRRLAVAVRRRWKTAVSRSRICCVGKPIAAVPCPSPSISLSKIAFDGEDFLLADAEEVVVVGAALDDRLGGVVQVGGLIDDDRRIARPGDDRPLLGSQRRPRDGRAAGDAQSAARCDDRTAPWRDSIVGWIDDRDQVVDADLRADRLVEELARRAWRRWPRSDAG